MNLSKVILMLIILFCIPGCEKPVLRLNGTWASYNKSGDTLNRYIEYTINGSRYSRKIQPGETEEGTFGISNYNKDTLRVIFTPDDPGDPAGYSKTIIISSQEKLWMDGRLYLKIAPK